MSSLALPASAQSTALAGDAICLMASIIWAVSIHLYRPAILSHGPRTVNLVKCVFATLLFGLTMLLWGGFRELAAAPAYHIGILVVSGLIGLSVGDSVLFIAVREIGIHRTQLIQTLAPVFASVLAVLWQGERFGRVKACGTALILIGVAIVVAPRRAAASQIEETFDVTLFNGDRHLGMTFLGVAMAVLAALCQGINLVICKVGMEKVPILPASFVRLAAGAAGLIVLSLFDGGLRRAARTVRSPSTMRYLVPAAFLGSYLGIFFMMAGLDWAPASIAAVLLATTPVFTMVFEAATGHEPFTWWSGLGTTLTIAGVTVLTVM